MKTLFSKSLALIALFFTFTYVSAQSITVTAPNGGETLHACQNYTITWTTSGITSDYYDIEYSLDGGTIWATIATNYLSTSKQFNWTIPQVQSTSCLIRVTDTQNNTITDQSDALFTINIPVTVLSPNGGESFAGGSVQTITWNAQGTSGVYDIFYSINGGSSWITVVSNYATGSATYDWTVPNTPSTNCLIRVRDDQTSCMVDQSDAVFTIAPLPPEMTSPNGGEVWSAGCSNSITWDPSTFYSSVRIDYSPDNGTTWNVIASSTSNDGFHNWTPPIGTNGTNFRIKVSQYSNLSLNDVSDTTFSILPGIKVTSANGGETWTGCSSYPITWNKPGSCISRFRIYYSIDNGANWTTIASNVYNSGSGNTQTYNWSVPNGITTSQALIKVVDYYNISTNYDESDATFNIIPSNDITVTTPNGGETLQANGTYTITWSNLPSVTGAYNIQYSVNGGASWSTVINNIIGNGYVWTVPNTPSTTCRVRVLDAGNTCKFDISDTNFTILPLIPELLTPNGGEEFFADCPQTITWDNSTFYTNVRLDYSDDNGATWNIIVTSTSNDGSHSWTPSPLLAGTNYKIRVSSVSDVMINDVSDTTFTLLKPIIVTSPNGGETVSACSNVTITWNKPGSCITRFTPAYSVDGGLTWTNIVNYVNNIGSGNTQSYNWSVPATLNSTQALIRISDYYDQTNNNDVSDAVFTIEPIDPIVVTTSNGGDTLTGCSQYIVSWEKPSSCIPTFRLFYSIDNGSNWSYIDSYESNQGNGNTQSYTWTVPNNITSTQCLIKVENYNDASSFDVSDANFTILPSTDVIVTSPNGGESFTPNTTQTITWTNSANVSGLYTVQFYNGSSWSTIASNISGNAYVWNVPNTPSTDCKMRVYDSGASCKKDDSDATFTIEPLTPEILIPNGGEQWFAGCSNTITWNTQTFYSNVRIDYSSDNGVTWGTIISNTSNDGSHSWTPPIGTSGNDYIIRVSAYGDLSTYDQSDATFSVVHPITVTFPNGGDTLNGCATATISWNKPGSCISRFTPAYSLDGGATWTNMVNYVNNYGSGNTQSFNWTVPNGINTSTALIKVMDYYNQSTVYDISDASFTLEPSNDVTVTSPNGGETLSANGTHTITWTNLPSASGLYNLQYSINGGASWSNIVTGISGNAYIWSVPNNPSTSCRIKVIDAGNTCKFDISDTNFTITPLQAQLLTPNGGETWYGGCNNVITWDNSTYYSNVRIDYSLDNGVSWLPIIASTSDDGSHTWAPPAGVSGTNCRIKVSSVSDLTHYDISDTTFTILDPIVVTSANGGETWDACSQQTITWTKPGSCITRFTPAYSLNGGATWTNIATYVNNSGSGNTQSYTWNVPANISSTQAMIRVTNYYATTFYDVSDSVFTINPLAPIVVTSPNGGETFNGCSQQTITWTKPSNCISAFALYYSTDNGTTWTTIDNYESNSGSGNTQTYDWTVPNGISTSQALVKVEKYGDATSFDVSDANFTLAPSNDVTITSPNGGELLPALSTYTITWSNLPSASGLYNLRYSVNGGSNWYTIANGITGNSYVWNVPNSPSTNCIIRLYDAGNTCRFDDSDLPFTIVPQDPVLLTPNGGESLATGCSYNITWDNSTYYSNVRIDYSVDNGLTWAAITTNTSNDGSYSWAPTTGVYGDSCLLKVSSTSNLLINDVSDSTFEIRPPIIVQTPNGGDTLQACSNTTITWTKPGTCISRFRLYYSLDAGSTWSTIASLVYNSGSGNTQSYNWSVPNNISSTQAKIKVVDYYNTSTIYDESDSVFTINPVPQIELITPNGGETWNGCAQETIVWKKPQNCISRFTPAYSIDGGATWTNIVNYVNNIGSDTVQTYNWTVPTGISSTQAMIKVMDYYNQTTNYDTSDVFFTITSNDDVTLTSPNGGEYIQGLSTHTISWNNTPATTGSYNIYYSVNGGTTWNTIITGVIGNNYFWDVPNTPSDECLIRILDAGNSCRVDLSDSLFHITPATPIMTAPNGGESFYSNTSTTITWDQTTYYSNVRIDYSHDNGFTWNLITGNTSNDGAHSWSIPNVSSTECLVRVSNTDDLLVNDVSDTTFEIRPAVTILTPNGDNSASLGGCAVTSITFDHTPAYNRWNIRYSTDNGATWNTITTNWYQTSNPATYNWTVPNITSSQVLVKVEPYYNVAAYDESDTAFEIDKPVTIIQPNFGGLMQVGSVYNIEWDSDGISNLYDIHFSNNGGATWTTIVTGYNTSTNTYPWTVPNSPSSNCLIRVRDNIDVCKEDISDVPFTITTTPPAMTLLTPNGGDTLSGCFDYDITWSEPSPAGTYDIAYSTDNGTTWTDIVTNYATGTLSYTWTVPNVNSSTVLARVKATGTSTEDLSNALFTIEPSTVNIETSDTTVCGGSPVQLIASGTSNYLWTPSLGLSATNIANPMATPSSTTTYYVQSTVGACITQDSITITTLSAGIDTVGVTLSTSPSNIICSGTPVTFTATPTNGGANPAYQWQVNGVIVGSNSNTYSSGVLNDDDVVSVILTSDQTCVTNTIDTASITMDVSTSSIPAVAVSLNTDTIICAGTDVTFTAAPTNGGANPSYQWQINGTNVGTDTNVYNSNTLSNGDIVTVILTSSSTCAIGGAVTSTPINMTVNPIPSQPLAISGPSNACENSSATYSIAPVAGATGYTWTLPSGWTGSSTTDNINVIAGSAGGIITVGANSSCGTSPTQSIVVGVNSTPTVTANATTLELCSGEPVTLSGTGASTYVWDNGVTNGTPFNPTFTSTYSVTGTDINGCSATDQVTVTVNALPAIGANATSTDLCEGTPVTLTGSGGTSYAWSGGVTDGIAFTPTINAIYTVTGTDANGCSNTDQVTVNVHSTPSVQAGADQAVCEGASVTLTGSGANIYTWNNGITDNTPFNAVTTNTYVLTGTDTYGCSNTDTVVVTVNNAPNVVANTTASSICIGTPITLTGAGANSYTWNFGVTDGSAFTPSSTATYTVTGTDVNGCTNTDQVTVNVNALPTVVANTTASTICPGETITLTGSGANTYTWDNSALNGTPIAPAATTTYTVTGTDANGCTGTDQVMVTVNSVPSVQAGPDQTVCEGEMVTLSGSGANTYSWNNGITNNTPFTATATTTYIVTGTGANGCTSTDTVTVFVNNAPTVNASTTASSICIGTPITLTGSGADSYSWNFGVTDGSSFTPSTTATYVVTGTDVNGCTDTDQVTVTVNSLPTVTANASATTLCSGGNVTLTGSGANTYSWDNGAVDGTPITLSANTTFTVVGTDINGCTNTDQVSITMTSAPNVQAGPDQTVCEGEMVTLTASGANTYLWNQPITNGVPFAATTTTTYIVTGAISGGCTGTDTVTVFVNNSPSVAANTTSNAVCIGSPVTLTGSGANSYTWDLGVTDGTAFTPATTATYSVIGTDANGCTDTNEVTVTVNNLPTVAANASATSICPGGNVTLTGSGASTYTWDNGAIDGTPLAVSGNTTFTVTGTDANGCQNTDQVAISMSSIPNVQAGLDQTVCEGEMVTLSGSGANTYSWNNGVTDNTPFAATVTTTYIVTGSVSGGCSSTDTVTVYVNASPNVSANASSAMICVGDDVTFTGSGADSYSWNFGVIDGTPFNPSATNTYTVTGTDANGCTNTDQVTVSVNTLPTVVANSTSTSICPGSDITLTGSGANSYAWDNGALDGVSISPTATTTYTVTGTDANGCMNTDQITITAHTAPNVQAGQDISACQNEMVTLSGSGANSYSWDNGVTDNTPFSVATTMSYIVTGTDVNGCTNTDTVVVNVNAAPTVTANASTMTICLGDAVTLNGSGANSYNWSLGVSDGVSFTPSTTQTYNLTGTDVNGCTGTDQITITVNDLPNVVAIATETSVCPGADVTLTATGANVYTWDNGAINGVPVSPSATTTYTVTGTDANGCTNTDQATVSVSPIPNVDGGADQVVCEGDLVTLAASGANAYNWNNGVTDNTAFPATSTNTYIVTGSNGYGCEDSDTVIVTVNTIPTVVANATVTDICGGEDVILTGSGAATFTWDNGVTDGVVFNPTTTEVYTVTGTASNGCTNTDQITVNVSTAPTPTVSATGATLTTQFFTSYQWYLDGNPIPGATSQTYDFTQNGYYAVEVTGTNGCTAISDDFNVNNVGLSDEEISKIKISPNPTSGEFNINFGELEGTKMVRVIDITGKLVLETLTSEMDLSTMLDVPSGYYRVLVLSENGETLHLNTKLVIVR